MRWSEFYLFTAREAPRDAEVVSHTLMVRSGMTRKLASGIYSVLPMGQRSFNKLQAIVHREMAGAGSTELAMPAIQPAELWQESGRWSEYGRELLRMQDRHERDFCFGPTHEEVITDIVRRDVKSYRQLPVNLYQIQTKFRDEIRPRFGLMRGREFMMKDAYTFHANEESLDEAYEAMRRAYCGVFEACRLEYTVVEADSGSIGGRSSHEFMVVADTGESSVVRCPECHYGANVEKATSPINSEGGDEDRRELAEVTTPGAATVAEVAALLDVEPTRIVKTLLYETADGVVAALVRGDREINDIKLANLLGEPEVTLAGEETVRSITDAPVGFAGPVGLPNDLRVIGDHSVCGLVNFVCGANKADAHLVNVNWGRDAPEPAWHDLLLVRAGDPCPKCGTGLRQGRGIEVGHIFKLGTKYSDAMEAHYTDENGESRPMEMGCYGLGIGRTIAAAIEQNHDDDGIIWPQPLAPFELLLISLNPNDPDVARTADTLYAAFQEKGVDVLYDDREERPGVKFKDADLIGIPVRVVVGAKSLADDKIELSLRRDRERQLTPTATAVERALELLLTA